MKKALSITLVMIMLLSTVISSSAVTYVLKPGSKYPTIYVPGRTEDNLVDDVDSEDAKNIRGSLDINVSRFYAALSQDVITGIATDNWTNYCNDLEKLIKPMYEDVVLDDNGEKKDNSGVKFNYDNIEKILQTDYTYRIDSYRFEYDWRIDPYENARLLDDYIKAVKNVTGAEKINLLGRCEGSNIVTAYLERYGNPAEIDSILFAWPSVSGLAGLTSFFTGDISLDSDALDQSLNSDATLKDVLKSVVSFLNRINLLDSGAELFNKIYGEIKHQLMPSLIMDTFGTMPSFWAMVDTDRYEEAKRFVFTGHEEQYARLIEKIDEYHYNVAERIPQILKHYTDNGVKFSCVAKYGYVASSLCTAYRYAQTDGMATVKTASLGCTSADYGKTLSYTGKYVSPNKIIDASTCLYPDSTWFVKNLKHSVMTGPLENFCARLIASETQPSVFDKDFGSQFLRWDSDKQDLLVDDGMNHTSILCSCDCHLKNPGLFWRIKLFFWKLFRIKSHQTCKCGVVHY